MALANEKGFPHTGEIDFIDNEVDVTTGTIELRARLENADQQIFPGLFVRVKLTGREIPDAVQVPQVAVGTDLGGKYVLAVGENNIVEQRYVELGAPQENGLVHIRDGLEGTETIIVNGLMFARPGMPVTPLTAEQFKAMQAAGRPEVDCRPARAAPVGGRRPGLSQGRFPGCSAASSSNGPSSPWSSRSSS